MKSLHRSLLALLVAGLLALPALAQSGGTSTPPDSHVQIRDNDQATNHPESSQQNVDKKVQSGESADNQALSDDAFLKKAAQDDLAEIQLGQLAQQKASSQQVKDLAKKLSDDHQKDLNDVKSIAQQKNINLPDQPSAKDQKLMSKLQNMNGQEFDRAFLKHQVRDHHKDIALYQREAQNAKDQDVKTYAQKDVAILQQHLQMSQSDAGSMGSMHHKQAASQNPDSSMR